MVHLAYRTPDYRATLDIAHRGVRRRLLYHDHVLHIQAVSDCAVFEILVGESERALVTLDRARPQAIRLRRR